MPNELHLQTIQDYLCIHDEPEPADAIFIFGSVLLPPVWERAAELYHQGFAPLIVTTGYAGPSAQKLGIASEGSFLAEKLMTLGVPSRAIIVEEKSSNTLENVTFGMRALKERGLSVQKLLLVAKPMHMRRCVATFARQFPDVTTLSCPPVLTLAQTVDRPYEEFVDRVAGEVERLERYAGPNGSIKPQAIPDSVRQAVAKIREAA